MHSIFRSPAAVSACRLATRGSLHVASRRTCRVAVQYTIFNSTPFSKRQYQTVSHRTPESTREAVIHALQLIGSKRETEQWLSQFNSVSSSKFAVIKVGGAILTDHINTLCLALSRLYSMDLFPVICHGAGPQLNKLLEDAGVEPQYSEGIRITDGKTLGIARKLFLEENLKLVEALEKMGTRARPITSGIFEGEYLDKETYKYVGKISKVNPAPIEQAIQDGCIPILSCMAETTEGQVLNVNADVAAGELAQALTPLKVVFLSEKGGLFDGDSNQLIQAINLDEEWDSLTTKWWFQRGTKVKLIQIKELLEGLPRTSSVAIISPAYLEKELFTDSGAGTLVRRGAKIQIANSINEFSDLETLKGTLVRDREGLDASAVVDRYIENLRSRPFKAYYDEEMQALAIVLPPSDGSSIAHLATFTSTKPGWLTNIADNLFQAIQRDWPKLMWTVRQDDGNLPWFYEKADGTVVKEGEVLFWYGVDNADEVRDLHIEFTQKGRRMFGDINLESQLYRAATAAARMRSPGNETQSRSYSTSSKRPRIEPKSFSARRFYATTNPNPPFGNKHASNDVPSKVALIGARGYTGKALVELLNRHPNMDLRHVSSRELAGQKLQGYERRDITYESLGPDDVRRMAEKGEIDCWVMALPNGVCKPYVDAIDDTGKSTLIIDLSADYRFDPNWTYGLPETVPRAQISKATRIANPGCYATAAQIGIAPLLDRLGGQPTVFGVSGYSGAGTKPSPKNDVENLTDNLIAYSLTDHVHEREITSQLGTSVAFVPHVAVWFQGIHHSISIPLAAPTTSREVRNLFADRYAGEPLIKVLGEPPVVKNIAHKHHIEVGGFGVHSSGTRVVVCCTIDNLLKGAATQCLQNMNLALGYPEFEGIPLK